LGVVLAAGLLSAVLAGCGGGSSPGAGSASLAGGLRKIVVFKAGVHEADWDGIVKAAHCAPGAHLQLVNAVAVGVPAEATQQVEQALATRPEVERIDEDIVVRASPVAVADPTTHDTMTAAGQAVPWGVRRIHADQAWAKSRGKGVKVAIVDTGICLTHPDLAANIRGNVNFVVPATSGDDDHGHGTHVAGTIAALDNSTGVVGVANKASLYAVKVLDQDGYGYLSTIVQGLQWCVTNKMQVINMSLGAKKGNKTFQSAVLAAYKVGIVQVAAAGNDYGGAVTFPGRYAQVIAVTALDKSGQPASFNSLGSQVALIAPGVGVRSTWLGGGYNTLNGTSMASPHVAGAVALKLAQNPWLSPDQVKAALQMTAKGLGLPANQQGAGLVDCLALVSAS
jgi:subtilisin